MVSLFGKFLKLLPIMGGVFILSALARSVFSGAMDQWSMALIAAGFVFFLAMFLRIEVASLRYYLNISILSFLMLAILSLVYILIGHHNYRWDLTNNSRHSLAPQTAQVLRDLRHKIVIEAIVPSNEPYRSYLQLYADLSDNISIKITNPYKSINLSETPGEERKLNDIVIHSGKRKSPPIRFPVQGDDLRPLEGEITDRILRIIQERSTRLYFTTGHGEKSPSLRPRQDAARHSFSKFAGLLSKQDIEVRGGLNLQADRLVPDDCDTLCIIGPIADYQIYEINAIKAYLKRGGSLLVALDPVLSPSARLPQLHALLKQYGVTITENIVLDHGSNNSEFGPHVPLIREFSPSHAIMQNFQAAQPVPFPFQIACAIEKNKDAPQNLEITPLLLTTKQSWTVNLDQFREMTKSGQVTPPSSLRQYNLAMAIGPKAPTADTPNESTESAHAKIVIFGDSDFLTNAQLGNSQANLAFFSIKWLSDLGNTLSISRIADEENPLSLDRRTRTLISTISVVLIPFLVFFGGLAYTTIRRRSR